MGYLFSAYIVTLKRLKRSGSPSSVTVWSLKERFKEAYARLPRKGYLWQKINFR